MQMTEVVEFCKQVDALIEDETKAVKEYTDLADKLQDDLMRAVLHDLSGDEAKHKNMLEHLKVEFCKGVEIK